LRGEAQRFACRRWAKSFVSSLESHRENDRVAPFVTNSHPLSAQIFLGEELDGLDREDQLDGGRQQLPAAVLREGFSGRL